MSSNQSSTAARARKPATADQFRLVYDTGTAPKSRHLDERCWKTAGYREATPDELKALPVCKHCAKRAERDAAKPEPPQAAEKPTAHPQKQGA